jgi:hypothetical protein
MIRLSFNSLSAQSLDGMLLVKYYKISPLPGSACARPNVLHLQVDCITVAGAPQKLSALKDTRARKQNSLKYVAWRYIMAAADQNL